VRIDLPVKAFIPPEWIGQEALRLELYRRIATARDGEDLGQARSEAEDRFGDLPPPVRALFAVAGLRLACLELGIEEVTTVRTRNQVRVKPVDEARGIEAAAALPEAAYHPATRTLNLNYPARLGSEDLAAWVREAVADAEPNRA